GLRGGGRRPKRDGTGCSSRPRPVGGNLDHGHDTVRLVLLEREPRTVAVHRREPLADIREADTAALGALAEAAARILDRHPQLAVHDGGGDAHMPTLALRLEA